MSLGKFDEYLTLTTEDLELIQALHPLMGCQQIGNKLLIKHGNRIKDIVTKLPDGSIEITNADTSAPIKEYRMSAPKSSSIAKSGLDSDVTELVITMYTDGRRTEVTITDPEFDDGYIAAGVAMRRKGEKPKQDAAWALAFARALKQLSEQQFKLARINGLPEAKR